MKWLLLLILLPAAPPARAEDKLWRVGLLANSPPPSGVATTWRDEILGVLRKHGFENGKNLDLVESYSDGDTDRLPQLAHELATINADVLVAISWESVRAIMVESQTTPLVVVIGQDPVALGLAASLARPGGKVTGVIFRTIEADAKRLEILRQAIPSARRFGYLGISSEAGSKLESIRRAADRLGVELATRLVDRPTEYEAAFAELRKEGAAGVVIGANQPLATHSSEVAAAARAQRLPTICEWAYMARAGCVFGFGHNLAYGQRRVGEYVARILEGARPAELPMERPDAWTLTINLRAAEAVGLVIPASVMARADEVIE
jgi:putative ABC transport system substrate-binding protein